MGKAIDICLPDWYNMYPDGKVHGANMGSIWGRQDPGGPHVGPMSFAIWVDVGARWAPCWPHELCYLGRGMFHVDIYPRVKY